MNELFSQGSYDNQYQHKETQGKYKESQELQCTSNSFVRVKFMFVSHGDYPYFNIKKVQEVRVTSWF